MSIPSEIREQVRQRANFACEFCGVSETDVGGQLTIDHFQPRSKGGEDFLENLLYCCIRCNQYKQDYWFTGADELSLWNPRQEAASIHFLELDDGKLLPRTPTGEFTIKRLRLNRSPLVTYRLSKRRQAEEIRLLKQYKDLIQLLGQLNEQLVMLVEEQQQLLEEQRELIRFLLRGNQ
jgi:hypothetical protein